VEYTVQELKEKIKNFVTEGARFRFAGHYLNKAGEKFYENPTRENAENFKKIKELNSNLFIKALDEAKTNTLIKKVNSILEAGGGRKLNILPREDHFERARVLWASKKEEVRKQAAREFELASENPKQGWSKKETLLLAAEAYGRLEMFEDELRLHEIIKKISE
jgi:translation initiation factor IF-2